MQEEGLGLCGRGAGGGKGLGPCARGGFRAMWKRGGGRV